MKSKLLGLVLIAIVLFATSFIFGSKALHLSNATLMDIKDKQLRLLEYTIDLDSELKKNLIEVSEAIILDDLDGVMAVHESFSSLKQKVKNLNKFILIYNDPDINHIVKKIRARIVGYEAIESSIINAIFNNSTLDKQDALMGYGSVSKKLSEDMSELRKLTSTSLMHQIDTLESSNKETVLIIFVVLLFGVVIILFTTVSLYRLNKLFDIELTRANKAEKLAKIGSWKLDVKKNLLTWSDEAYNIFEIDSQINTFAAFLENIHPDDKKTVLDTYNNHLIIQKSYHITHRLLLQDSSIKYIEMRYKTTFDEWGNPLVSEGTIQDITEQKENDKHLVQQARLAQMGEMISMIAHQWRQPLGAISTTAIDIKMQSELESFDLGQKEEAQNYEAYVNNSLDDINNFVQNLTTTIDDFRNFYKPNKKLVSVTLEDVISRSLKIMRVSLLNDNIEIIEENNSKEEIGLYDNEIMQVILNLLKNAQDNFNEKQIKDPYIKITTQNRTISICDNGGGIEKDILEKIFDPYFSTKSDKNGTGLGLYMSKTIIQEHHNGKLNVENRDDGVCFIIELGVI